MPMTAVYRKDKDLTGKELSANTLASFLVAQGVRGVPDLEVGTPMSSDLLLFLNRRRAIDYWVSNGWLMKQGASLGLTTTGLEEVQARETGDSRGHDGKRKPGNVDPNLIQQARQFILGGRTEERAEVLEQQFELAG